jgi:hypothetical protein
MRIGERLRSVTGVSRVFVNDMSVPAGTVNVPPDYADSVTPWILSLGNFDGDIDELRISTVPTTPP